MAEKIEDIQLIEQQNDDNKIAEEENEKPKRDEFKEMTALVEKIEQRITLPNDQLVFAISAIFGAYIALGTNAKLLCNLITIGYPAYESVKALITKHEDKDVQWLVYWAVFAMLAPFDILSDALTSVLPCYWFFKYVLLLCLCLPQIEGALVIYRVIFGTKDQPAIKEEEKEEKIPDANEMQDAETETTKMLDSSMDSAPPSDSEVDKQVHQESKPIPPPRAAHVVE